MAKKPAPLTSDLLVKKGDAAPSSIAPEAGSEPPTEGQEPAAAAAASAPAASETDERPTIPEPDYVIAPEDDEGEDRFQSRRLLAGVLAIVALATAGALGYSLFQNTETGDAPNVAPLATAEPETAPVQVETPSVAPVLQPSGPSSDGSPTPPGTPALRPSDTGPVADAPVEVVTPVTGEPDAAPAAEEVAAAEPPRTPATITPPPSSVPAPVERPAPAEPEATAAVEPAPALAQPGQYVIQLLSVRSEEGARNAWSRLQTAHTALLGNEMLNLETADLGDRGTYYRVRFGAFDAKADAQSVCTALKGRGQDCLVKRISN